MVNDRKLVVMNSGWWSTNIGNAFYNLGTQYVLQQIFTDGQVVMMNDQAGYHWFPKKGNPAGDLGLLNYTCPDYFVIQGPCFASHFRTLWYKTLTKMREQGTKIMFLAAGMMRYTDEDIQVVRDMLIEFPPYLIATRDALTYEYFHDLAEHAYNGIDTAFFVSDVIEPIPLQLGNYFILNFDTIPEPKISIESMKKESTSADYSFEWNGGIWRFKFPSLRLELSHRSPVYRYIDAQLPRGSSPKELNGYKVVRTDHSFNPPSFFRHTYKWPNTFVCDIPFPYFHLYANTQATFSGRVHACVATLAFGRPAMLFARTGRSALFDRVNLVDITKQPVAINVEYLNQEKQKMLDYLRSIVN